MFYIVDNKKTVQAIEKIGTGLKVWYTDGIFEELAIDGGSGDIPKHVKSISEDTMNDGIGVRYSDNSYERVFIKNTPTIEKCIYYLESKNDGTLQQKTIKNLNGNSAYANNHMYNFYNATLSSEGILSLMRGNRTQIDIDFSVIIANTINTLNNVRVLEDTEPMKYYKIVDGDNVEITKEEFENMPSLTTYYKIVDGVEVEITEEEFNNMN